MQEDIVDDLLKRGASTKPTLQGGWNPVMAAAAAGNFFIDVIVPSYRPALDVDIHIEPY
jgi:hypothetical protein